MTKLLLDFPWHLEATIDDPDVGIELERYLKLLDRTGLDPVGFIEDAEQATFFEKYTHRLGRGNYLPLSRFLLHCRRKCTGSCESTIDHSPSTTGQWRRGLRDELNRSDDWRTPQIVISSLRVADWPIGAHVGVATSQTCQGRLTPSPRRLVLAPIDGYEHHPYSVADRDPWDVRITAPSDERPCYLPNPLILDQDPCRDHLARTPIHNLSAEIDRVRRLGCHFRRGYYYYIPPDSWDPLTIDPEIWRSGHAFPRKKAEDRDQVGPIDFEDHVWTWDENERHWDVQHGGNQKASVNHLGIIQKESLRR